MNDDHHDDQPAARPDRDPLDALAEELGLTGHGTTSAWLDGLLVTIEHLTLLHPGQNLAAAIPSEAEAPSFQVVCDRLRLLAGLDIAEPRPHEEWGCFERSGACFSVRLGPQDRWLALERLR